jgi:hypothetical protein
MMLPRLGLVVLLAAFTVPRADLLAQEPTKDKPAEPAFVRGDHHLIFRVETELQRLLIRPLDAKIVVVIDGERIRKPDDVDEALVETVRRGLAGFARRGEAVHFILFFGDGSPVIDPRGMKTALAHTADALDLAYYPDRISSTFAANTWREHVAPVADLPGTPDRDEPGFGDGSFKVYPVRTPLGRYLAGGNDCVLDLPSGVAGENQAATLDAIRAGVSELRLGNKRGLLVRFYNPPPKDPAGDANRLAKGLGFKDFSSFCCAD